MTAILVGGLVWVPLASPDEGQGDAWWSPATLESSPCDTQPCPTPLSSARTILRGALGSMSGAALTMPGDVDGDGLDDLIVGSYAGAGGHGAAYVLKGPLPVGEIDLATSALATITSSDGVRQRWGLDVAAAGDTNADGKADFWVAQRGSASLFVGGTAGEVGPDAAVATLLYPAHPEQSLLIADEDLSGDGVSDVIMAGLASDLRLMYGPFDGTRSALGEHDLRIRSDECQFFGGSAAVFDADGDGLPDVAAGGASRCSTTPNAQSDLVSAVVVEGGTVGEVVAAADGALARLFGPSDDLASGDLDGDGYEDLVVTRDSHKRTFVVLGPVLGDISLPEAAAWTIVGAVGPQVGSDAGLDGRDDLVLTAWRDLPSTSQGAVLYPDGGEGIVTAAEAPIRLQTEPGGDINRGASAFGDLDGDGQNDLVLGYPRTLVEDNSGAIYLLTASQLN